MNQIISFTVPGKPNYQKQTRFRRIGGRILTYDPSVKEKKRIQNYAREPLPLDFYPLIGPIKMTIVLYFPYAKGTPKKRMSENAYDIKRPDIDNCCYLVTNALKEIIYHDDNQICSLISLKRYSTNPRTDVTIEAL